MSMSSIQAAIPLPAAHQSFIPLSKLAGNLGHCDVNTQSKGGVACCSPQSQFRGQDALGEERGATHRLNWCWFVDVTSLYHGNQMFLKGIRSSKTWDATCEKKF